MTPCVCVVLNLICCVCVCQRHVCVVCVVEMPAVGSILLEGESEYEIGAFACGIKCQLCECWKCEALGHLDVF